MEPTDHGMDAGISRSGGAWWRRGSGESAGMLVLRWIRGWPGAWAGAGVLLLACFWLDSRVYHLVHIGKDQAEAWLGYHLVRGVGGLWFWVMAGLVAGLLRRGSWRVRVRTALLVFFGAGLSGLGAEVVKVVVGRERPLLHDGSTVLQPLATLLSAQNLSFPSSHAAVALGGAVMVWRLSRARGSAWRWGAAGLLTLAVACGMSRLLTGAHFLSDIVGAALVAVLVTWLVRRGIPGRLARALPEVFLLKRRRRIVRA